MVCPFALELSWCRQLETDDATDDEPNADEPSRVRWLVKKHDAKNHGTDRANPDPHTVCRSYWQ